MKTLLTSFLQFFRTQASGGAPLLLAAALALVLANGPLCEAYERLWETPLGMTIGFSRPLRFWINDGLMAVFFLVVGLEIKREFIGGELSGLRKAALPILAALGGMLCPALLYIGMVSLLHRPDPVTIRGWGIPTVTDIAFALGALALLGQRVPAGLKIFLSALAIIDDLGAIVLIAVFYSHQLATAWILLALILLLLLWWLNRCGVKALSIYLMAGTLLWAAILNSGLHPTLAGVLLALTIPSHLHVSENPDDVFDETHDEPQLQESPLQRLADWLQPWVSYGILPLFALCNAGVSFSSPEAGANWWENPISWGVILGLLLGKPLGIALFSWLAVRLRLAELPQDVNLSAICATGFLGGIGFTMSLFIALLAFQNPTDMVAAKIAIVTASLLSGFMGLWTLRNLLPQRPN